MYPRRRAVTTWIASLGDHRDVGPTGSLVRQLADAAIITSGVSACVPFASNAHYPLPPASRTNFPTFGVCAAVDLG